MNKAAKLYAEVCSQLFQADVQIAWEWSGDIRKSIFQAHGRHVRRLSEFAEVTGIDMAEYAEAAYNEFADAMGPDADE